MASVCPADFALLLVFAFVAALLGSASGANLSVRECPPKGFDTQGALEGGTFNLTWYTEARWHIQMQMPTSYLPSSFERCVTAEYEMLAAATLLGYNIKVHNHAENGDGKALGPLTTICSKVLDASEGKAVVSPCFLPSFLAGAYWVVAFSVTEEWAVVSGGPPTIATPTGCKTGAGVNGSGLWIFTRQRQPPPATIDTALAAALAKGFDVSVLDVIDQSNCGDAETPRASPDISAATLPLAEEPLSGRMLRRGM